MNICFSHLHLLNGDLGFNIETLLDQITAKESKANAIQYRLKRIFSFILLDFILILRFRNQKVGKVYIGIQLLHTILHTLKLFAIELLRSLTAILGRLLIHNPPDPWCGFILSTLLISGSSDTNIIKKRR